MGAPVYRGCRIGCGVVTSGDLGKGHGPSPNSRKEGEGEVEEELEDGLIVYANGLSVIYIENLKTFVSQYCIFFCRYQKRSALINVT